MTLATPRGPAQTALPGIARVQEMFRTRELTVRTLVEGLLDRHAATHDDLGAYTEIDPVSVRAQADALDTALAAGARPGPLFGVPIAVKDMIDVAGLATRAGSRVLEGAASAVRDASVVADLRRDHAVIMGKTATHEFAMGTVTPQTRNPHARERIAGGSSGGSAAAVAAGLALGALGTDTGGSIRIPAALCGVVGLKPRPGVLDSEGIIPLSPIADVAGPIAATVADTAALWRALVPGAGAGRRIRRVGVPHRGALGELEPAVESAFVRAQQALESKSIEVVEIPVPNFERWFPVRLIPLYAAASRVHRARGWFPDRAEAYSTGIRAVLQRGSDRTTTEVLDAWAELSSLSGLLLSAMDDVDALLLPTTPISAPAHTGDVDDAERQGITNISRTLTRLCAPFNWVPLAAISVPFGADDDGLPLGMQVVASDEVTALNAAALLEKQPDSATPARPGRTRHDR